jgi:hypothetical protein
LFGRSRYRAQFSTDPFKLADTVDVEIFETTQHLKLLVKRLECYENEIRILINNDHRTTSTKTKIIRLNRKINTTKNLIKYAERKEAHLENIKSSIEIRQQEASTASSFGGFVKMTVGQNGEEELQNLLDDQEDFIMDSSKLSDAYEYVTASSSFDDDGEENVTIESIVSKYKDQPSMTESRFPSVPSGTPSKKTKKRKKTEL